MKQSLGTAHTCFGASMHVGLPVWFVVDGDTSLIPFQSVAILFQSTLRLWSHHYPPKASHFLSLGHMNRLK